LKVFRGKRAWIPRACLIGHTGDTDSLDYIEELLSHTARTSGMDRYGLDINPAHRAAQLHRRRARPKRGLRRAHDALAGRLAARSTGSPREMVTQMAPQLAHEATCSTRSCRRCESSPAVTERAGGSDDGRGRRAAGSPAPDRAQRRPHGVPPESTATQTGKARLPARCVRPARGATPSPDGRTAGIASPTETAGAQRPGRSRS